MGQNIIIDISQYITLDDGYFENRHTNPTGHISWILARYCLLHYLLNFFFLHYRVVLKYWLSLLYCREVLHYREFNNYVKFFGRNNMIDILQNIPLYGGHFVKRYKIKMYNNAASFLTFCNELLCMCLYMFAIISIYIIIIFPSTYSTYTFYKVSNKRYVPLKMI